MLDPVISHRHLTTRLAGVGFVIFVIGFFDSAIATEWPTDYEFKLVNRPVGTPSLSSPTEDNGFRGKQALAVEKMEEYLGIVACHYEEMGFAVPYLEMTDGLNGGKVFVVRLYDYSDESTHARYAPASGYMEIDLSRAIDGQDVTAETIEALAHELFHAIQRSYKNTAAGDHGNWITEGQAQAIGMDIARATSGVDVHQGDNDDYRLGGREYLAPLPTNAEQEAYRTASFWRYLAEVRTASHHQQPGEACGETQTNVPDYRYLQILYEVPFAGAGGDEADLKWLDTGLRKATSYGLAHNYAQFITAFADYVPSRLTKQPDDAEQAQDKWLERLFAPCPEIVLTATEPSGTTTSPLRKNAARCLKASVEAGASTSPQRASNGSTMLRRLRGGSGNSSDSVDLVVQARSAQRSHLEALWLGTAGGEDVAQPYIGRDRQGYVGSWHFDTASDKPETFVISNFDEDPGKSLNQDVELTLTTNSAHMSSSASGPGNLAGGPIELRFDQFPSKDILSAMVETQVKAGIEQPCMIRLHMKNSSNNAAVWLLMDNDGRIQPGTFTVAKHVSPEKAPGQFQTTFSFGTGRDRVIYEGEGGTVDLSSFSPHILQGKANLSGRLPPRGYGDAESSWPETMAIQVEFTVVPRVNIGSKSLKADFCFAPIGES